MDREGWGRAGGGWGVVSDWDFGFEEMGGGRWEVEGGEWRDEDGEGM